MALTDAGRAAPVATSSASTSPFYNAALGNVYASNYIDIISSTNSTCGSVCTATTGYDFATGVGSPNAAALIPYLQSN